MLTLFRGLADIKNYFKESCQSHRYSILKKVPVLRVLSYSMRNVRAFKVWVASDPQGWELVLQEIIWKNMSQVGGWCVVR